MFQVVTLSGIAGIYDADDGFSNVMAGIVAAIHVLISSSIRGYPGSRVWRQGRKYQLW